ncbi:MAG: CRTAC1 family protein [Planctomycetota bacterium]|jgi:hypothetical protein
MSSFRDMADETGLSFAHRSGRTGRYYMPETMGSGAALFDYDRDGDLDVYLVQGHELRTEPGGTDPVRPDAKDRLFRNDLDRAGTLHFTEVTAKSGIEARGYGMGVIAGDYDNDGWTDLYVTNFGSNQLLRNQGDGTFRDVTAAAGADDPRWSTSAAFVDFDRDGWLDLYVCAYVHFSYRNHKECYSSTTARDYCGPDSYEPVPDRLFRNRGDGTFVDVTAPSRVATAYGPGLGVACADFDGDGRVDLYVANDGQANQLWRNRGDGTFEDTALLAGCALNASGSPEAGMGVDAADFDHDGDEDLFLSHLTGETNTLYVNDGTGSFADRTSRAGLGAPSLPYTGFGAGWLDYDNDGRLDLLVVSGAVKSSGHDARPGRKYPPGQANLLFRNVGRGRFRETSRSAGPAFHAPELSRGAAFGDVDNDGDTDVLVTHNHGPARLFLNEATTGRHWLGLRLVAPHGSDRLGTCVEVFAGDGPPLRRRCRTDGSYCSSRDPRVLVGLGEAERVPRVRVRWPDGAVEEFRDLPLDRYATLVQGAGRKG